MHVGPALKARERDSMRLYCGRFTSGARRNLYHEGSLRGRIPHGFDGDSRLKGERHEAALAA